MMMMIIMAYYTLFTSGDVKAVLTVHHPSVDPEAVPGSHVTQRAVTHRTLTQTQACSNCGLTPMFPFLSLLSFLINN